MLSKRKLAIAAIAALALAPLAASAREESKIRLFMEKVAGGSEKGMLRSQLAPGSAVMRLHVNHLAPNLEHFVFGDGALVARFTTNAKGNAEVRINLFQTGGGATPTFDPRGKFVTVNDGANDVLAAWVYADPADDPARVRIKERTQLARDDAATQGAVHARYDALPSGGARLAIWLRGVASGDYDVRVDGASVAVVTPNPDGNASVDLRVRPGGGNASAGSKPHKHKGQLTGNPRSKLIEVFRGTELHFSGDMLAQIPGLGVCTASSRSTNLTADPTQMGTGSVALGVEASCDLHMTLTLTNLAAGEYDLVIGGADAGDIAIANGGSGTGSATLEYDEAPSGTELAMPAGVATDATIAIQEKPPLGTDVVLSGNFP